MRFTHRYIAPAAVALTVCAFAPVARAQFTKVGIVYYVSANHTLQKNVSGNDVLVGKATDGITLPGSITFTVATGAKITAGEYVTARNGVGYSGLNVFGKHRTVINGGSVESVRASDDSTATIKGGSVTKGTYAFGNAILHVSGGSVGATGSAGSGTVNISGGRVQWDASVFDSGVLNISGGDVHNIFCSNTGTATLRGGNVGSVTVRDTGKFTVRGGVLKNGILLRDAATVNFVGTGMTFAYKGYGKVRAYDNAFADRFLVTGTGFAPGKPGAARTYDVYIRSEAGTEGKANRTARQFTFNGVAPVAAP